MREFGGDWTETKLDRLASYLQAYLKIFTKNRRASQFRRIYVDGFAGSGFRRPRGADPREDDLFSEDSDDADARSLQKGSADRVLSLQEEFHEYLFIDRDRECADALEQLKVKHPDRAERIRVECEEANTFLRAWCDSVNWTGTRAVVFLDPFGMQVEWGTIEAIARTEAIDLWVLVPIGQAVNRLLVRRKLPGLAWAEKLTRFFGTNEWKTRFYSSSATPSLFEDGDKSVEKVADFATIGCYFVERLEQAFKRRVAPNPLALRNSRGVPIFLLCFAAGNPTGAGPAIRIANHLLKE